MFSFNAPASKEQSDEMFFFYIHLLTKAVTLCHIIIIEFSLNKETQSQKRKERKRRMFSSIHL